MCTCNQTTNTTLCQECESTGCKNFIKSECINNVTTDLECSNIIKGQTLDETLVLLDAYICTKFDSIENFFELINVGTTGARVYKGVSMLGKKELRRLVDSNLINIVEGTNDITISVDEEALSTFISENYAPTNVGTGARVFKELSSNEYQFRKIKSSDGSVTVVEGTDDIDLSVDIISDHTELQNIGTNTHAQIDTHIGNTSNPHNVTKAQVGLSDVDNTSDANKPISTTQQTALNTKEPTITAGTVLQYFRGDKTWQTLNKTVVGLNNVDNTTDLSKPISTATQTVLNEKVSKYIKSNEPLSLATRKDDVLYGIIDRYTGEEVTLSKVTGTPTVDNIIYFQLGSEYFKRNFTVVNIKWFGAVGIYDDCTSAIVNALAAMTKGTLFFPTGNYISSPISMKVDVIFEGDGLNSTRLQLKANSNADFLTFYNSPRAGVINMNIVGDKATNLTAGSVIRIKGNTTGLVIENNLIQLGREHGIFIEYPAFAFNIRNNIIIFNEGYGLYNSSTDNTFSNNNIYTNSQGGIYDSGGGNYYIGGKIATNSQNNINGGGIYIKGARADNDNPNEAQIGGGRITFTGLEVQENYYHGIVLDLAEGVKFVNVSVESNNFVTKNITPITTVGYGVYVKNYTRKCSFAGIATNGGFTQTKGVYLDTTSHEIDIDIIETGNLEVSSYLSNENITIKTPGLATKILGDSYAATNATTTVLSEATLTSTYPTATKGFKVHALDITVGGRVYEKTATGWCEYLSTIVT